MLTLCFNLFSINTCAVGRTSFFITGRNKYSNCKSQYQNYCYFSHYVYFINYWKYKCFLLRFRDSCKFLNKGAIYKKILWKYTVENKFKIKIIWELLTLYDIYYLWSLINLTCILNFIMKTLIPDSWERYVISLRKTG